MTYKLGLIGYPVSHSLSPRMHNAALRALQLDGEYAAIAVAPDVLRETLPDLIAQGYHGLNVTIPHKQAVLPFMDELSDAARAIGAVNTIVIAGGKLIGHNTDAVGFMRGLESPGHSSPACPCPVPQAPLAGAQRARHRMTGCNAWVTCHSSLVLGAGGGARAVVYALTQARARVTIWNRTRARAAQLAREFGACVADTVLPPPRCGAFDLIVNTTSVGMMPRCDETPLPLLGRGVGAQVVYDLVYNPRETILLRDARAIGAQAIGGLDMLIYQGAAAFRLWTGRDAPIEVMRQALEVDR